MSNPEIPRGYAILAALLLMLPGLFLILASLDVIPYPPQINSRKALFDTPHHWEITTFGFMFFLTGVMLAVPTRMESARKAIGATIGLLLLAGCVGIIPKLLH